MAMKDLLDRFKKAPGEEVLPEEPAVDIEEKPSFVFTDINSDPIDPEPVPEAPVHHGPVRTGSSNEGRVQMFEIDLGGSNVNVPEEPAPAPVSEPVAAPEKSVPEDTIVMAPVPESAGEEDYEVDFGYAAPGALDDVTYTTAPETIPQPKEPEPVVYKREPVEEPDDDEYYDSYEPIFEEPTTPGNYFAPETPAAAAAAAAEPVMDFRKDPVEAADPDMSAEPAEAPVYTEKEAQPRYENYRKDYRNPPTDAAPRTYENKIDDSVFLPDEGDAPLLSPRNRRMLTIGIAALLLALLVILGALFLSHHNKVKNAEADAALTSAKVSTTAFERSVSNNKDATETTTEEESAMYDDDGQTSTSSSTTAATSSRTRTSLSSTRTTTTRSTTTRTTRTTTSRTSTTPSTQPSTAPPTEPSTPSTPSTQPPTSAPSPWEQT